jgi:hypothetical protein
MDFVSDRVFDGRLFQILTVVDCSPDRLVLDRTD